MIFSVLSGYNLCDFVEISRDFLGLFHDISNY